MAWLVSLLTPDWSWRGAATLPSSTLLAVCTPDLESTTIGGGEGRAPTAAGPDAGGAEEGEMDAESAEAALALETVSAADTEAEVVEGVDS